MNKPRILVVEDDRAIRKLISTALETQGYQCRAAETGEAAILEAVTQNPDIVLLDLGLPDMDGVDFIRKLRGWSNMPIIVVSARGDDRDKIDALDAGADDYLTKPFSVEELLARIRVSLRRVLSDGERLKAGASVFQNGRLRIDYAAGCAYLGDEEVHLTPTEYRLLCALSRNVGKVLTHNALLREVWGGYPPDLSALRVSMATLRRKIERGAADPFIQTHIGVGYRMLRVPDEAQPREE